MLFVHKMLACTQDACCDSCLLKGLLFVLFFLSVVCMKDDLSVTEHTIQYYSLMSRSRSQTGMLDFDPLIGG